MKTLENMVVLDAGEIDRPEYRAAAKAALLNGKAVSLPGMSVHMPNTTTAIVTDVTAGKDYPFTGKTADQVLDTITAYKSMDRILAFLGS